MCGIKSKRYCKSYLPLLLLYFLLCSSLCYAEVTLTDAEAQEILSEIEQSKTELQEVKKDLKIAQNELQNVKNIYSEQNQSYEKQLNEVNRKNKRLSKTLCFSGSANAVLVGIVFLFILL